MAVCLCNSVSATGNAFGLAAKRLSFPRLSRAAPDEAWERLLQSGSRLAKPAYSRAIREIVAKRIIEMAQRRV
jgi:hypothetical protein